MGVFSFMSSILKIIAIVIGAMIGAGFASGQEIYVFFYQYGKNGIYGLFFCSLLISVITYKVLKIIKENNIVTYKEFIDFIIKGKNTKVVNNKINCMNIKKGKKIKNSNKYYKTKKQRKYLNLSFIINTVVNVFLLITFYIMIAGFGAYFSQELNISNYIGSAILSIMCFASLMKNTNGVIKINTFLIPILIIFVIIIGSINMINIDIETFLKNNLKQNAGNWLLSSLLYASYNSILLIPVLITLNKLLKNKMQIGIASAISGIIILILGIILFFLIAKVNINIETLEMPVVYVISTFFAQFKAIYAFIILASIYTTAISLSISLLNNIAKNKKSYTQIALFMCITGWLISGLGFSNLINLLYPIFGYLGLAQIVALIIKWMKKREKITKNGIKNVEKSRKYQT